MAKKQTASRAIALEGDLDTGIAPQFKPVRHGKFLLGANGLRLDPDKNAPTFSEWEAVGEMLATMERGQQFCVGDWMLCGEERFNEEAAQAIDARAWSEATVKTYRWLASRIAPADRRMDQGLTVRHHLAVAKLPPAQQRKWLDLALGDGEPWTVARLVAAIREGKDPVETAWWVLVGCGTRKDQEAFQKEQELKGRTCRPVTRRSYGDA